MDTRIFTSTIEWQHLEKLARDCIILFSLISLILLLPPLIYSFLVWRQFGFLNLSGYMPIEEVAQAFKAGDAVAIMMAPVISMNMTSGELLATMYSLTVGQLLLSILLGSVLALNILAHIELRRICSVVKPRGTITAAGSGLFATVAASSTGIMGCCGSSFAGGVLALAGIGATTANAIAGWSTPVQILFITGFTLNWFYLRQRLRSRNSENRTATLDHQ